jgi:hypothetical protein
MAEPQRPRPDGSASAGPLPVEEVAARAARLGITVERVLDAYGRIGFATLGDIVEWDETGMKLKADADTVAVIEIVASAKSGRPYRIKLHDRKPVLDALSRATGIFPEKKAEAHEDGPADDGEDPREYIIRAVDRVAAEEVQESGDPGPAG